LTNRAPRGQSVAAFKWWTFMSGVMRQRLAYEKYSYCMLFIEINYA
jgi:hypothetical protein